MRKNAGTGRAVSQGMISQELENLSQLISQRGQSFSQVRLVDQILHWSALQGLMQLPAE